MTTTEQAQDSAGQAADAAGQTVSRDELNEAIKRRTSALDRARAAEDRLATLEAAQADRDRADKERQGKFKELAQEAEAKANALSERFDATQARLEAISSRHRKSVDARFEALPEDARNHLAARLGDKPNLEALDDAVSLAESLRVEAPGALAPRNLGAQPSAGRVGKVITADKASIADIAKMTRTQQAEYLKKHY